MYHCVRTNTQSIYFRDIARERLLGALTFNDAIVFTGYIIHEECARALFHKIIDPLRGPFVTYFRRVSVFVLRRNKQTNESSHKNVPGIAPGHKGPARGTINSANASRTRKRKFFVFPRARARARTGGERGAPASLSARRYFYCDAT